ncbi:MAG: Flp family type IVb pilin [Asticcacaulis sp.]|uniref:Flp family type IVb pilin n=1 Tax=Asticcacaulis sp. TaxID=1872648 RepID=UPI0039E3784F
MSKAQLFPRFLQDESGATAIEYAMIAGLIFLAIVTSIHYFTDSAAALYNTIGSAVTKATN